MSEVLSAEGKESLSGDLVDAPVNMRQILSGKDIRELAASIEHVLKQVRASGGDEQRQAVFVAHFLAPRIAELQHGLADARLQAEQSGEAMLALLGQTRHVTDLAMRRATVATRLRAVLWEALPDAELFRTLTEQRCPIGAHTGWYAPSNGFQHPCPWCLINELRGADPAIAEQVSTTDRTEALNEIDRNTPTAEEIAVLEAAAEYAENAAFEPLSAYDMDPDIEDDDVDAGDR